VGKFAGCRKNAVFESGKQGYVRGLSLTAVMAASELI
jgi:hypothetical protein